MDIDANDVKYQLPHDPERPGWIIKTPVDFVLTDLFERIKALEQGQREVLRFALHEADQGNVPQVQRLLRNALEELQRASKVKDPFP